MVRKINLLAGASLTAMLTLAGSAALAASASSGPSTTELEQRIDRLEGELQNTQVQAAKDRQKSDDFAKKLEGWWSNTSISGRMYYDISWIEHETNGVKTTNDNGTAFDIKRFYVGIDHKFNDMFSANITTDFQYSSAISSTEIYIKKAYLQAKFDDALVVRLGSTDTPWVPFVEDLYGYRYIENTLIDRTKFGTSADWGVHASGKLADGVINYAVAVVNGAGYKSPPGSGNATHFQTVDVEGRVNLNWMGFVVGVGGYTGKLGKDVQTATTHHTANRLDAVAAYTNDKVRLGVEYFMANDWNNVTTVASDKAEGIGAFASYKFDPKWSVFGKYEYVEPTQDTNPSMNESYFNAGISFSPAKIVDFALVYKHDEAENGSISTSNGTIGGAIDGSYDEVGLFGQFRW